MLLPALKPRRRYDVATTPDVDFVACVFDGRCHGNAGFCDGRSAGPELVWAASGVVAGIRVHRGIFRLLGDIGRFGGAHHAVVHVTV